jgi:hypothetical protein
VSQFIAYHVDRDGKNSAPVATGNSMTDATIGGMANVAMLGVDGGTLLVEERNDLSAEIFEQLRQYIDTYFNPVAGSA